MRSLRIWRSGLFQPLGVFLVVSVLGTGLLAQPPAAAPELLVEFGEREVAVGGVAPGSRVAWLSLASEPHRYHVRDVRREGIEVAGADGIAVVALDAPVPPRSVWGFVDLASGASVWASPEGFLLEETAAHADQVRRDDRGLLARLGARGVGLELLLARPVGGPGQSSTPGAWALTVFDGGPSDRDGASDGGVEAAAEAGRPILDSPPPPDQFLPGDVIMGVDPNSYRVFTLRLPGGAP